jgi:uncharacterized protein YidB (DUF937 family)
VSLLNDVIGAALREHNVSQVGSAGTERLIDAIQSLLAPKSTDAGTPTDKTHVEPDALQQLLARFEQGGYTDIIRSWIGTGANQPIEPHQLGQVLGPGKIEELSRDTGLPHHALLEELARLLPTVIDRLTPQGQLPQGGKQAART